MAATTGNDDAAQFKASFHIVIIGAGLVGLSSAILLRKAGYNRVTVLERDPELREVNTTSTSTSPFPSSPGCYRDATI